jgi:two-component system, cell cycle response regulator
MSERILIIEDNQASLDLMEYLLGAFGYATSAACDGLEGLDAIRRQKPDLVVCDIDLPKLDGCSVAREVRADPQIDATLLVAVTAFAMVGDSEKLMAAGFDGYIAKPIDPQNFVREIESFLKSGHHAASPFREAPGKTRIQSPDGKKARLLVVDDSLVNLNLHRSMLEPFGYVVVTASGTNEGLEIARRSHPDLILSDVIMSEGSGFDFLQAAKADPELRSVPFILITSTAWSETARTRGIALGAARFLFRPIEPSGLLLEVESCLREKSNGQDTDHR